MRWLQHKPVAANLVLALVYALVGYVTLELGETGGVELRRVVWSSSGIAVTAGILARFPVWWGAGLGGALATLLSGSGPLMVVGTAIANGLEVGLTVALLRRLDFDARLERVRDVMMLIAVGPGGAALVGAIVSVGSLALSGGIPDGAMPRIMVMWWLTHAVGIVAITPAGLTLRHRRRSVSAGAHAESVALLLCIAITSWIPFHAPAGATALNRLFFLPLPLLQWAALRIGAFGTALGGLITTSMAIAAAVLNSGPLAGRAPTETLVLTWLFSNVAILPALITSALVAGRERSEKERQRLQLRFLQGQKMESLGVLAGGIAHDFNNLLTAIRARAELLRVSPGLSEDGRDDVVGILRATDEAAGLCRQMLTYAGRGTMAVETLDLSASAQEICDLLRASMPRGVDLQLDLSPEPLWVAGDKSQVRQVILNLVVNGADAAKAGSHAGCVTVRTRRQDLPAEWFHRSVAGGRLEPGSYAMLEVTDDGVGMAEETLQQIFDPFVSSKGTGRGLGLPTVLGVIRGHRGALVVESQPGRESRFQVAFPLAPAPAASRAAARASGPDLAGRTVLVVDDDAKVRTVVSRLLKRAGLVVREADDGDTALEALSDATAAPVDVVLLDLTMPRMSGTAALQEMRRRGLTTPVVLASGYSPEAVPAQEHADGFVQKPFRLDELMSVLDNALRTGAGRATRNPSADPHASPVA